MSLQLATWGASGGGGLEGLPDEDVASEMAELLGEYDIEAAPIDFATEVRRVGGRPCGTPAMRGTWTRQVGVGYFRLLSVMAVSFSCGAGHGRGRCACVWFRKGTRHPVVYWASLRLPYVQISKETPGARVRARRDSTGP
jgi:hypothetical protein